MNRMLVAERREAGESFNEIARALGVPRETVRSAMVMMRTAVPDGWKYDPRLSKFANVIELMCEARRQGRLSKDEAWRVAMREMPPRAEDSSTSGTLFDEDGQLEESLTAFRRRVAMNAWDRVVGPDGKGQGKALKSFSVGLLDGLGDCSAPAGIVGSTRAA